MTHIRRAATALLVAAVCTAGCKKDKKDAPKAESAPGATNTAAGAGAAAASAAKVDTAALAGKVGVDPGPIARKEGPAAVLAKLAGKVEIKKLGEETFAAARDDQPLYAGDQLRAGDGAKATVVFADESSAELAEATTITIGSRVATADPASSAAVLGGVARFTITPRAPAEGPFLVFAPAGVIATKGTVFGVGVAADGDARVGVESGQVEVAGAAALAKPVDVEAGAALELPVTGVVASPAPWPADDWGVWIDGADASVDVAATVDAHAKAMDDLSAQLEAGYAQLQATGVQVASFEASASAAADAGNASAYQSVAVDGAVAIDASFLEALRLEMLTHAYEAHADLAADLYVRHPDVVVWAPVAPQVAASVLWPKRFDATAAVYLEPLRVQYYIHHPRGRLNASLVGIAVPSFYAQVTPPDISGKVDVEGAFTPPVIVATASARPVWIAAPTADWRAKVKIHAAPPRADVGFWVRPPELKAHAMLGADIKARIEPMFDVHPPSARGALRVDWGAHIGSHIHIPPPDLRAAAEARAHYQIGVGVPDVDVRGAGGVKAGLGARAHVAVPDVKAKVKVVVPDVRAKVKVVVPDVRGRIKAGIGIVGGAASDARAGVKAGASVKVKAPTIHIKPPSLKVKAGASVKAGGKLKIGH